MIKLLVKKYLRPNGNVLFCDLPISDEFSEKVSLIESLKLCFTLEYIPAMDKTCVSLSDESADDDFSCRFADSCRIVEVVQNMLSDFSLIRYEKWRQQLWE